MRTDEQINRRSNPEESMLSPLEGRCEVGEPDASFDLAGRTTWTVFNGKRVEAPLNEALVVSSQTTDQDLHRPVIDLDIPCRWVPSTTPGHGHLYIDHDLTWQQYERLLLTLAEIGLVEEGYVRASLDREATFVRLPWVRKVEPS